LVPRCIFSFHSFQFIGSLPKKLAPKKGLHEPPWPSSRIFWLKHWVLRASPSYGRSSTKESFGLKNSFNFSVNDACCSMYTVQSIGSIFLNTYEPFSSRFPYFFCSKQNTLIAILHSFVKNPLIYPVMDE